MSMDGMMDGRRSSVNPGVNRTAFVLAAGVVSMVPHPNRETPCLG
jgi:hypothetical protein